MMLDLAAGSGNGATYHWLNQEAPRYAASAPSSPSYGSSRHRQSSRNGLSWSASDSGTSSPAVSFLSIVVLLSWVSAIYLSQQSKSQITELRSTQATQETHYRTLRDASRDVRSKVREARSALEASKKATAALEQELRVLQEVEDGTGAPLPPTPKARRHIASWLEQRQDGLRKRLTGLQRYVQTFSRQQVRERWGPGPHRVGFTVEYNTDRGETYERQIVAELASTRDMPHAVHFFLEMVELRFWDHTVMLHHEQIEHLIAAVPIDFRQQQFKHSHLAYLGWTKLAFPEFSPRHPHDQYTLGFAGNGPTWYWNTIDNRASHGPGGFTAKKLLADDADPCIGRVVEGHDVLKDLVRFGEHQHKTQYEQGHPWADEPHTWTHLVKVELLRP